MARRTPRKALTPPRRPHAEKPVAPSTRERIHAAALKLFSRYGFDAVTLQQVADEVGIHKSSLFHHYGGKLDLAYDVFIDAMEDVARRAETLAGDDPPRLERFLEVLLEIDDVLAERPVVARLILSVILVPTDSDFNFRIGDDPANPVLRFFGALVDWLVRARDAGAVRRDLSIRQAVANFVGLGLFYPAAAPEMPYLSGPEPFGPAARRVRRRELERMLRGVLDPD